MFVESFVLGILSSQSIYSQVVLLEDLAQYQKLARNRHLCLIETRDKLCPPTRVRVTLYDPNIWQVATLNRDQVERAQGRELSAQGYTNPCLDIEGEEARQYYFRKTR